MEEKGRIEYVLFDLDETMYSKENGLMELVSQRISDYMSERMGIDPETVSKLRREYYERYGTTGRGLFLHHDLDEEDYFTFVHDLPVEDFLKPDEFAAYVFHRDEENGGHRIDEIEMTEDGEISQDEFVNIIDALYEETIGLRRDLNDEA